MSAVWVILPDGRKTQVFVTDPRPAEEVEIDVSDLTPRTITPTIPRALLAELVELTR